MARSGVARQGSVCYTLLCMTTNKHERLIAMRLPPSLLKKVDQLAKQEERSRSAMVRRLLQESLALRKPEVAK